MIQAMLLLIIGAVTRGKVAGTAAVADLEHPYPEEI
jgi:hypothetical protein